MRLESRTSLQQEVGWSRDMVRMARYLADIQEEPFVVASLENITDELAMWNSLFPGIKPTFYVGSNPLTEVMDHVLQLGTDLHVRNKRDLALVKDVAAPVVYSASTKLGSAIKAAAASGVQVLYVDSVAEMEKIKKFHPSARIVVELSVHDIDNSESLDAGSGIKVSELSALISEGKRLDLEISGLALNLDVLGSLDQDENLVCVKYGLEVAEAALKIAREANLDLKTLHLGQICVSSANVPSSFINEINNIVSRDVFSNLKISADASSFLIASSVTLAAKIIDASDLDTEERMTYAINESVFGAFSINLSTPECCIRSPLILGGGGRRKGLSNKLLDTGIFGVSGQSEDVILPMGEIMLPRLELGDWLLFPNMGAVNLSEYDNLSRRIVGNKTFVCVRKPATRSASERATVERFTPAFSEAATVCIDLDQQLNMNCIPDNMGLKGEIDLRKTFIYED